MNWKTHSGYIKDAHAFLSPSGYSWLNYDEEKLVTVFNNMKAKERGTQLHAQAARDIELGLKRPNNNKSFNRYVNDGIAYRMKPEQILFWSKHCFGTADTISFRREKKGEKYTLRIHDLKTGQSPVSMKQLYIYCALFFLEYGDDYGVEPEDCNIELRIYQHDEDPVTESPSPEDVHDVMNKIVTNCKILEQLND